MKFMEKIEIIPSPGSHRPLPGLSLGCATSRLMGPLFDPQGRGAWPGREW